MCARERIIDVLLVIALSILAVALAGCQSTIPSGLPPGVATTPTVTAPSEATTESKEDIQQNLKDIRGSMVAMTETIQKTLNTTTNTITKQLTETVSGMKANTAAIDTRVKEVAGNLTNVSKQVANFGLDETRAKQMMAQHKEDMERQVAFYQTDLERTDRIHWQETQTIRAVTCGFISIIVGVLVLLGADNLGRTLETKWLPVVAGILALALIAGGIAVMFFFDSIKRYNHVGSAGVGTPRAVVVGVAAPTRGH